MVTAPDEADAELWQELRLMLIMLAGFVGLAVLAGLISAFAPLAVIAYIPLSAMLVYRGLRHLMRVILVPAAQYTRSDRIFEWVRFSIFAVAMEGILLLVAFAW